MRLKYYLANAEIKSKELAVVSEIHEQLLHHWLSEIADVVPKSFQLLVFEMEIGKRTESVK